MRQVLDVFVPGHPKTKGSLDHIGQGKMRENVQGSKAWRQLMAYRLRQAWNAENEVAGWPDRVPREPLAGAVRVSAMFYLPCARGQRSLIARGSGDVDKLVRNLLDALTDSGVIKDDAQVTGIICDKAEAHALAPQGVKVTVWQM